jgi:hypothetical protein
MNLISCIKGITIHLQETGNKHSALFFNLNLLLQHPYSSLQKEKEIFLITQDHE